MIFLRSPQFLLATFFCVISGTASAQIPYADGDKPTPKINLPPLPKKQGLAIPYAIDQQPTPGPTVPAMKVTATSLRVRDIDGNHLCSLPEGTVVQPIGRTEYSERIEVKIDKPNCPKTGFVSVTYIRPAGDQVGEAVTTDGLNFRKNPDLKDSSIACTLLPNTKVSVLSASTQSAGATWVKVGVPRGSTPDVNCPTEGWVVSAYLKPTTSFDSLPVRAPGKGATEAEGACVECAKDGAKSGDPKGDATDIAAAIASSTNSGGSSFLASIKSMLANVTDTCPPNNCNRGLIQMPLLGTTGNIGVCGSFHYNPDEPIGQDAYASPRTACVMTALLKRWKTEKCPNQSGCTVQWGDISDREDPEFHRGSGRNRHREHIEHTNGTCVDIRPMRKGGFEDSPVDYRDNIYDHDTTDEFLRMAVEMGASKVLFNDKSDEDLDVVRARGHDNHMHMCFEGKKNEKANKACEALLADPKGGEQCPELSAR